MQSGNCYDTERTEVVVDHTFIESSMHSTVYRGGTLNMYLGTTKEKTWRSGECVAAALILNIF